MMLPYRRETFMKAKYDNAHIREGVVGGRGTKAEEKEH